MMTDALLLAAGFNNLWHALPLVVVICLVYSATRHEAVEPILSGAARFSLWVIGFMLGFFVLLVLLSWQV
jgi:hypothetical protein